MLLSSNRLEPSPWAFTHVFKKIVQNVVQKILPEFTIKQKHVHMNKLRLPPTFDTQWPNSFCCSDKISSTFHTVSFIQNIATLAQLFPTYSLSCNFVLPLNWYSLYFFILFKAKPGCPVSPEGFEENQPEPVKQVIREIQQHYSRGRDRSLLVGSRSWLSCITKAERLMALSVTCCCFIKSSEDSISLPFAPVEQKQSRYPTPKRRLKL